jgi:fumarate hydratase class II
MPASQQQSAIGLRIETDSLGEVAVPAEHYWGAQTERARQMFRLGRNPMPLPLIQAIATIKRAAAKANQQLGQLDEQRCQWISQAAAEVEAGQWNAEFPLSTWQSGSGTQTNMNVNEVIANRACELAGVARGSKATVHPNDHVNRSQSTNDVFPSAIHLAAERQQRLQLLPQLRQLVSCLEQHSREWNDVVKIGRTHLQDAVPLTLGQEVGGWAAQLATAAQRLEEGFAELRLLPLGGTAVGTGLGAPPGFGEAACLLLSSWEAVEWRCDGNLFALMGSHDALVQQMARLRLLAGALHKIVNDIRLLACGPRAGLAELLLPANEPGSSIMPGKVNPTQCEAVAMATAQVIGLDQAVAIGGSGGHLQMNVYKPLLGLNLLEAGTLLCDCCRSLREHLLEGMQVNHSRVDNLRDQSLMLVTALAPVIGYDRAAAIALHAHREGLSLKQAALALDAISGEAFEKAVDATRMARPHG